MKASKWFDKPFERMNKLLKPIGEPFKWMNKLFEWMNKIAEWSK